jgi:hypothetical protein
MKRGCSSFVYLMAILLRSLYMHEDIITTQVKYKGTTIPHEIRTTGADGPEATELQ